MMCCEIYKSKFTKSDLVYSNKWSKQDSPDIFKPFFYSLLNNINQVNNPLFQSYVLNYDLQIGYNFHH